jgi:sterol desaturase/sphingolipid hydroxylase (fatty acid hydroxylase superfamily)
MSLAAFAEALRPHAEAAEYAAFFGMLLFFGMIELLRPRREPASERRRRWPANFAMTVLNILVLGALPVSALAVADFAAARGWGLMNRLDLPILVAIATGILARTLVSYGVHVAMHKVPLFWRIHRVHHTDRAMDVTTTVRFHPLEFAVSVPFVLVATLALGISPAAIILYQVLDAAMAVFTHADVRLAPRLERALGWLLVTPAMHRIHHSSLQPETDSNYGATLSLWDRLFGTYRRPALDGPVAPLGLAEYRDERADSLWWLLRLPFLGPKKAGAPA